MAGKWEGLGYNSQSEADFALCCYISRHSNGSEAIIDHMFRNSGMMRDKWDERRPGGTYGSETRKKALAKTLEDEVNPISITLEREDMPESVLDGALGEICQRKLKDMPIAYAWPALVTIAGTSEALRGEAHLRGNLFTALVGPPGTSKSDGVNKPLRALGFDGMNPRLLRAAFGSEYGFTNAVKEAGPCVRLLAPDELSHTLRKCAIENSTFAQFLCSAFYFDRQHGGTKKETWEVDCRLSIFGSVVEADFGDCFGLSSARGLYDRFLFGLCPQPYEHLYRPYEGIAENYSLFPPRVDGSVWEVRDEWVKRDKISPRVAEICLRVAYVCAAFEGRALVGLHLEPAHQLALNQMKVRRYLAPNERETADARCAIKITNWLTEKAPNGEWVSRRDCYRGITADRFGPSTFYRCVKYLAMEGRIETDRSENHLRLCS